MVLGVNDRHANEKYILVVYKLNIFHQLSTEKHLSFRAAVLNNGTIKSWVKITLHVKLN